MTENQTINNTVQEETNEKVSWGIVGVIIFIVFAFLAWFLVSEPSDVDQTDNMPSLIENEVPRIDNQSIAIISKNITQEPEPKLKPEPYIEVNEASASVISSALPEVTQRITLPLLNESDPLVESKLPNITWQQELLKLVITDDIIRRFVVFTDNFSQGNLVYDRSLLIRPKEGFSANKFTNKETGKQSLVWNEKSSNRFNIYVDLLRSFNTDELISFYISIKPLIDEAYQELGYPEKDFTDVLQLSILQVLDAEAPDFLPVLSRTSVMYTYADKNLEALSDSEKLLLRLGKENVLVIKSVLLDISEKLAKAVE